MPWFDRKCLTIKTEWAAAAAASSKQNKLPLSQNCSLMFKICFNDLAISCANNLMFTAFCSGTNCLWITLCISKKGTNIVVILNNSVSTPYRNTSRNDTTEKVWPHYTHIYALFFPVTHLFTENGLCDSTAPAHCSYVWMPNGFYVDLVCQQHHIHQYLTEYAVAFLSWQLQWTHELMITADKILFNTKYCNPSCTGWNI